LCPMVANFVRCFSAVKLESITFQCSNLKVFPVFGKGARGIQKPLVQ
jgi:hypothetical protein